MNSAGLVAWSLRQRLWVAVATAMLIVGGMLAARSLPIDAFPDVSTPQVKIILKAPGMTPEEVETRITAPVEQAVLGLPRARILRSSSKYALTDITIDFEEGTDVYWARQQVSERLASVMQDLPPSVTGGLAPLTTPLGEMYMFTIEGPQTLAERRTVLDWTIRPALRGVPGVADVNSLGGMVKTFEVAPDLTRLAANGLTLANLETALRENNRNDGAGRLNDGEEALLVRAEGAIRTLDDLRAVVVHSERGHVVRVADVADVRFGHLTRYGAVTGNGQGETVQGLVLGLRGANAAQVVEGVRARLEELAPALPKGMRIVTFYDRSNLVDRAVHTVSKALVEAILLVLLVLVLFLGNARAAIAVAVSLPLAALATFVAMKATGISANLMSLGGLAIAIGMLVDAAVVVVENVEAHLSREQGSDRASIILEACREVMVPVVSGVLIIAIVFVPLLSLEGIEGKLFGPVALAIVYALSSSLLISLTVVPVLCGLLLRSGVHTSPRLMHWLEPRYRRLLEWALTHGRAVFLTAGLALAAAIAVFLVTGRTFMPVLDEGDFIVQLEKLPSIGLEQTVELDTRVQAAILKAVPDVKAIVARSGADEIGLDPMGLNQTDTFLVLKPREAWQAPSKEAIADQVRRVLDDFPGTAYTFTQPIDMRVAEMLTGVRGDLAIKIFGPDLATLNHLAHEIAGVVGKVAGAKDTLAIRNAGVQYLQVRFDRLAAGRQGLSVNDLQDRLHSLVEGAQTGIVLEGGRRVPLVMRGADDLRQSAARLEGQVLETPAGNSVTLAQLTRIERSEGPVKVDRENTQRYMVVQSGVSGRDLVGFVDEAKTAVAREVKLPEGYRLVWGGQFENQQRAAARLGLVVPVALALIFAILMSTLGSARLALLVFANIPFALIGGVLALGASGEYLSVPASVGFIALLGIAVLNGVVLVDTFNRLVRQGMTLEEAVRQGALRRLRPVLMTATTTALGLLPLLVATGPGSEIQRPLAIVVIGGLASSTALTLLLLPLLYRRFGLTGNTEGMAR
ncbi:MAG: efflux RND transporter permease subunit [Rhodocyclaceae bacterium]|nr:efflux RND transporter permease subunit [Rhodocyclaceae bacterium]